MRCQRPHCNHSDMSHEQTDNPGNLPGKCLTVGCRCDEFIPEPIRPDIPLAPAQEMVLKVTEAFSELHRPILRTIIGAPHGSPTEVIDFVDDNLHLIFIGAEAWRAFQVKHQTSSPKVLEELDVQLLGVNPEVWGSQPDHEGLLQYCWKASMEGGD